MIKRFCDGCKKEMFSDPKIVWHAKNIKFESFGDGDFCLHCIIDAVKSLDDRVQPSEPILSEPPVIMPAWKDLPKVQMDAQSSYWEPEKRFAIAKVFYNFIRNALQSLQKPKGAA